MYISKKSLLPLLLWATPLVSVLAQRQPLRPFQLGVIDEIQSTILGEKRVLNIYLPEGYSPDSAATYPVIYLLDGSSDEDFIHVVGLVQFCNFSWVDILPKSIVVGIANVDRRRDFTHSTTVEKDKKNNPTSGGSARFIDFLEKELIPHLQKNYKANGDRMLLGQSLGGLLATEILFKKPGLFNQYIIVSPSLWWDNGSLLGIDRQSIMQLTRVFVAVGREGKIMERGAKKLFKILQKTTAPTLSVEFEFLKNKNHANIYHQVVSDAFEWFKTVKK
jgi:uncharacterized protein